LLKKNRIYKIIYLQNIAKNTVEYMQMYL